MGGHNDTHERDLALPRDRYPTSERHTFLGDNITDGLFHQIYHTSGIGNKWWDKTYSGPLNIFRRQEEDTGAHWYRRLDHIGEREKRINHLPLSAMVDAERGNYNYDKHKFQYCNHLRYHYGNADRWENEHKTAHGAHARHAYDSCIYNNEKVGRMEAERMRRLGEAGVLDAIREKSKFKNKFIPVRGYRVIDFNRFRDEDNSWETYEKRKAAGEFVKNPQRPEQGKK